jgi:plasmid stabilization system protein ParE
VQLYQEQVRDRGRALVMEVRATIDRIKDLPRSGSPHQASFRRAVLSRFPFSLVYRLVEDDIEIIAVMHHRRRPGYWRIEPDKNGGEAKPYQIRQFRRLVERYDLKVGKP